MTSFITYRVKPLIRVFLTCNKFFAKCYERVICCFLRVFSLCVHLSGIICRRACLQKFFVLFVACHKSDSKRHFHCVFIDSLVARFPQLFCENIQKLKFLNFSRQSSGKLVDNHHISGYFEMRQFSLAKAFHFFSRQWF